MRFLSKNALAQILTVTFSVLVATLSFVYVRDFFISVLIIKESGSEVIANIAIALLTLTFLIPTLLIFRKFANIQHASPLRFLSGYLTTIAFLFLLFSNIKPSTSSMTYLDFISITSYYLAVGFTEEILFRGILFDFVKPHIGLTLSLLYTSLLFGLFHFSNIVFGHPTDINQVITATIMGVIICSLYYFFGFLVAVLSHTLINISAKIFLPTNYAVTALLVCCVLSVILVAASDILSRKTHSESKAQ